MLVGTEIVSVVHTAAVLDADVECASPAWIPCNYTVVCIVGVGADEVAVAIVNVEVEVGVAITAHSHNSPFAGAKVNAILDG